MATYGQQLAGGAGERGQAAYSVASRQQAKAAAPKGRGGTTAAQGAFNQAHPRTAMGRVGGGQFAKKSQTQAQLRKQQRQQRPATTAQMLKSAGVKSVAEFQKSRGLPVTGKLDQRTVVALRNAHTAAQVDAAAKAAAKTSTSTSASVAKPGVVKLGKNEYAKIGMGTKEHPDSRVKNIQTMLEHLGYDVAVDGVFGPELEKAVRLFQSGYGLPPTGVVTVQAMRRINARRAEVESGKSRTGFLSADEPATRKGGKPLGGRGSTGRVSSKSPPKLKTTTVIMQAADEADAPEPEVHPDRVVVDGEEIVGPDVTTLPWWDEVEPVEEAALNVVWDKLRHPHDRLGRWARTYTRPSAQARAGPGPFTVRFLGEDRPVDLAEVHGMQTSTRVFGAFAAGMPLGLLTVDERRGTVELVHVDESVRRQGVASKLLAVARHETGLPLTADTGERSPSGAAFAAAAGLERGGHPDEEPQDLTQREADAMGARLMTGVYGEGVQFTRASDGGPMTSAQQYVVMPIPLAYQSREIGNPRTREMEPPEAITASLRARLGDALAEGMKPGRETTSIYEVAQHMAKAHAWPALPDDFHIIEEADVAGDRTGRALGEVRAVTSDTAPPDWTVSVRSETLDDGYGGLIFAHEMGHVLDAALAHERMGYIPVPGMLMMSTVAAGEPTAIDAQFIRPEQRVAWRRFFKTAMTRSVGLHPSDQTYTASPHELWARAYAQWLGTTMPDSFRGEFEKQTGAVHRWPPQEWEPVGKAVEGVLRAHHLLRSDPKQQWRVSRDEPKSIKMTRIQPPKGPTEDWTDDAREAVKGVIEDIQAGHDTADALELAGFEREDATTWALDTMDGLIYAEYDEDRPDDLMFEWDAYDRDYRFTPEPIFLNPDDQPEHRRFGLVQQAGLTEADVPVPMSRAAEKLLGLVGRRLNGEPVTEYDRKVQMGLTAETVREAVALTMGGPDEG
jgi:peptidoglycan hydrolase-like protein with peptidoglycan-binding domain